MFDDYDLDLSFYKLFYLVCQNGSFSKTAEVLGMTQPSVSYNIKKLEDKLNVKLFERGSNLILTPEGEALLPYVEEAINSLKKGCSKISDLISLTKGQIAIGIPSHIGVILLGDIIKKFNKEYPNIKMKIISKPTKDLFRLLSLNELDVVIDCSPLDENITNFSIVKIATERCAFACNKFQTNLFGKELDINEVVKYPLIVPSKTSGSTKKLMYLFEKKKIAFDPMFEVSTSDMIASMTENGLGIGYLFEKTIEKYKDLRIVDVNVKLPDFDIFLIYKERLMSTTSRVFVNFIKEKIKK